MGQLSRSSDFRRVSREGRRFASGHFVLLVAERGPGSRGAGVRLGLTVSRRVGGAVVRNRVKRLLREWFRRRWASLPPRSDVVVIARPGARELRFEGVVSQLDSLVARTRGEATT